MQARLASALPRERYKCSFGCPILDGALNGGIPCGCVTEIIGESSSTKTQLCLQLSLAVQRRPNQGGLHGSALYIYTEYYFPYSRLQQLAKRRPIAAPEDDGRRRRSERRPLMDVDVNIAGQREGPGVGKRKQQRNEDFSALKQQRNEDFSAQMLFQSQEEEDDGDPCKHVYVQGLQTPELLVAYLDRAESFLSQPLRMPVRLLVIDSIAALFQADFQFNPKELAGRSALLFTISSKLRRLAEVYDLAVLVTNHVTDYFESVQGNVRDPFPGTGSALGEMFITSGRRVAPALGISWAQCVNVRLFLSRSTGDRSDSIQRSLRVILHLMFLAHRSTSLLIRMELRDCLQTLIQEVGRCTHANELKEDICCIGEVFLHFILDVSHPRECTFEQCLFDHGLCANE